jgi:hypothetical protein
MYNPHRAEVEQARGRRENMDVNAGIRHSEIVKREGVARGVPTDAKRTNTAHGLAYELFDCQAFQVRHEVLYAKNSTGVGINDEGDRVVIVQRGVLFATVEDEKGNLVYRQLQVGGVLQAKRSTRYALASSGVDSVELLVIETPDYDKTWKVLGDPVVTEGAENQLASATSLVTAVAPRNAALDAKTREQAAAASGQPVRVATKKAAGGPDTVLGVNPRPSGPPVEE